MNSSQRSFDQVKGLLGKLDRNIDAARARRLHGDPQPAPAANQTISPGTEPTIGIKASTTTFGPGTLIGQNSANRNSSQMIGAQASQQNAPQSFPMPTPPAAPATQAAIPSRPAPVPMAAAPTFGSVTPQRSSFGRAQPMRPQPAPRNQTGT